MIIMPSAGNCGSRPPSSWVRAVYWAAFPTLAVAALITNQLAYKWYESPQGPRELFSLAILPTSVVGTLLPLSMLVCVTLWAVTSKTHLVFRSVVTLLALSMPGLVYALVYAWAKHYLAAMWSWHTVAEQFWKGLGGGLFLVVTPTAIGTVLCQVYLLRRRTISVAALVATTVMAAVAMVAVQWIDATTASILDLESGVLFGALVFLPAMLFPRRWYLEGVTIAVWFSLAYFFWRIPMTVGRDRIIVATTQCLVFYVPLRCGIELRVLDWQPARVPERAD